MSNDIAQDVCKSVRALGFSAPRTRRIVDGVVRDISNNGPEWVADRLKGLTSYYTGVSGFPGWVKRKVRHDHLLKPKGWMGELVGSRTSPDTIVTVLSTVRGAMVFDSPTPKQLQKWNGAVTSPPTPRSFQTPPLPWLERMEEDLVAKIKSSKAFGPDDIHGSRYPRGVEDGVIRRGGRHLDMQGLYRAWRDSLLSAPSAAWTFQDQSGLRMPGLSLAQSRPILNQLRKEAPDAKAKKRPGKKSGRTMTPVQDYPLGHISFLQEPFGKLRTVANPNRFVQWQLTPLGEVLSDWINHRPGVYNLNQEAGIQWIQARLREGVHLTSADLSSASDTLDFVQVTNALKAAGPNMKRHLEYFEQCSKMPWYVTNPVAQEFIGSRVIRWKQGQPLGLRPSFPILSITNWMAARQAIISVDGHLHRGVCFAIVGDDIVIESKYSEAYQECITALGGVANLDKSMSSASQAEFCSRWIREDKVTRLKPRWLPENPPQNLLTYQGLVPGASVPHWVRRKAMRVGAYALQESGIIPLYHPHENKSLRTKVLVHAVLSLDRGKATPVEKSLHSMWLSVSESETNIARKPRAKGPSHSLPLKQASARDRVDTFVRWNPTFDVRELPLRLDISRDVCKDIYDKRILTALWYIEADPRLAYRLGVRWIHDEHPVALDRFTEGSARVQTVETVKTRFDHKSDTRKAVETPLNALKKLDRKIQSIERDLISSEGRPSLIRRVAPHVDELVESHEDGSLTSTFYGKKQVSPSIKISTHVVFLDEEAEANDEEPGFSL